MKNPKIIFTVILLALFSCALTSAAIADTEAEKAAYKRNINNQVQDLQLKIGEMREDHKEDGMLLERKIKEYEDRIAQIQRESDAKINDPDWDKNVIEKNAWDVRRNFHEWRLTRAINKYDEKIEDLKLDAKLEQDMEIKRGLEERIQQLNAKYTAAKAKLMDLKVTDGDNWNKIETELNQSLEEIKKDYKEIDAQYTRA